jgi:molecular chaperone DnaK
MKLRFALLLTILACGVHTPVAATIDVEPDSPATRGGRLAEAVGLETLGGVFTPILESGCSIPCEVTQTFSTAANNQTEISIALYRGSDKLASKNHFLGRFLIADIPAEPRGVPRVAVSLRAEAVGIVLAARDLSGAPVAIRRESDEEGASRKRAEPRSGGGRSDCDAIYKQCSRNCSGASCEDACEAEQNECETQ